MISEVLATHATVDRPPTVSITTCYFPCQLHFPILQECADLLPTQMMLCLYSTRLRSRGQWPGHVLPFEGFHKLIQGTFPNQTTPLAQYPPQYPTPSTQSTQSTPIKPIKSNNPTTPTAPQALGTKPSLSSFAAVEEHNYNESLCMEPIDLVAVSRLTKPFPKCK